MKKLLLINFLFLLSAGLYSQDVQLNDSTLVYSILRIETSSMFSNDGVNFVSLDNGNEVIVLGRDYRKQTHMYILNDICQKYNLKVLSFNHALRASNNVAGVPVYDDVYVYLLIKNEGL